MLYPCLPPKKKKKSGNSCFFPTMKNRKGRRGRICHSSFCIPTKKREKPDLNVIFYSILILGLQAIAVFGSFLLVYCYSGLVLSHVWFEQKWHWVGIANPNPPVPPLRSHLVGIIYAGMRFSKVLTHDEGIEQF